MQNPLYKALYRRWNWFGARAPLLFWGGPPPEKKGEKTIKIWGAGPNPKKKRGQKKKEGFCANAHDGKNDVRWSPANAYLKDGHMQRPNLYCLTGVQVNRVLLED